MVEEATAQNGAIGEGGAQVQNCADGCRATVEKARELRGLCVTCGGVEDAIAEEPDARGNGTGPARGEGWVARS
jgi:hypothetical protein